MYDDGGDDYDVSEEHIRIYRPYAVGEIIEARNHKSWQKAKIMHVVSPQIVYVRYNTADVQEINISFLRRIL